jgi:hypothetical protein
MSLKKIIAAAKKAGLPVVEIEYGWVISPGGNAPCWSIYFDDDAADEKGAESFMEFANTQEALEWIGKLNDGAASP